MNNMMELVSVLTNRIDSLTPQRVKDAGGKFIYHDTLAKLQAIADRQDKLLEAAKEYIEDATLCDLPNGNSKDVLEKLIAECEGNDD